MANDNDNITTNMGSDGRGNALGKGITQQTVNIPIPGNPESPVNIRILEKTVDDLSASMWGDRRYNSPGVQKMLETVLERIAALEREVVALRSELHDKQYVKSGASQNQIWAIFAMLLVLAVALMTVIYMIANGGG